MAERIIQESTLSNIANAIRRKTGGTSLITPENMAGQIDDISTSEGIVVNGSVKTYSVLGVGNRINRGDFVHVGFESVANTDNYVATGEIKSIKLTDGRVLVICGGNTSGSSSAKHFQALVVSCENGVTSHKYTNLLSKTYGLLSLAKPVQLPDGRIMVIHGGSEGTSSAGKNLRVAILSVDSTGSVSAVFKTISSNGYDAQFFSDPLVLPDGRIFVAFAGYPASTSYHYARCAVISLSDDDTVSATITNIESASYAVSTVRKYIPKPILLSDNSIVMTYCGGNTSSGSHYVKAAHIIVNEDNSITFNLQTIDNSKQYIAYSGVGAVPLSNDRVFVVYSGSSTTATSYYNLRCAILSLSGEAATPFTIAKSVLDSNRYACYSTPKPTLLSDGRIFIGFIGNQTTSSGQYLRTVVINVAENNAISYKFSFLNKTIASFQYDASPALVNSNQLINYYRTSQGILGVLYTINDDSTVSIFTERLSQSVNNIQENAYIRHDPILLSNGAAFVSWAGDYRGTNYDNLIYGFLQAPSCLFVRKCSDISAVSGVAKNSGDPGETIGIYVPN